MTRAPKLLDPKATFMARPDAVKHAELVATEPFKAALEAALALFALDLPRAETLEQACRAHYELIGARKFVATLLNLCEPAQGERAQTKDNLAWGKPDAEPHRKP